MRANSASLQRCTGQGRCGRPFGIRETSPHQSAIFQADFWSIVDHSLGEDLHLRSERFVGFGFMDLLVLFGGKAILSGNPGEAGLEAFVDEAEKANGWHGIG